MREGSVEIVRLLARWVVDSGRGAGGKDFFGWLRPKDLANRCVYIYTKNKRAL